METLLYRINYNQKSNEKKLTLKDIKGDLRKHLKNHKTSVIAVNGEKQKEIKFIHNQLLVYTSHQISNLEEGLKDLLSEIIEEEVITQPIVRVYVNNKLSTGDNKKLGVVIYFGKAIDWLSELEDQPLKTLQIKLSKDKIGEIKLHDAGRSAANWYQMQESLSFTMNKDDQSYLASVELGNHDQDVNGGHGDQKYFIGQADPSRPPLLCILEPVHEEQLKKETDYGLVSYIKSKDSLWVKDPNSKTRRDHDWYQHDGEWFDIHGQSDGQKLFSFNLRSNAKIGFPQLHKPDTDFFLEIVGFAMPDVKYVENRNKTWIHFDLDGKPKVFSIQPKSDLLLLVKKPSSDSWISKTFKNLGFKKHNRTNENYLNGGCYNYQAGRYKKVEKHEGSSLWYLAGSQTYVKVLKFMTDAQFQDDYRPQDTIPYSAIIIRPNDNQEYFGYINLQNIDMAKEISFSTAIRTSSNTISLKWLDTLIQIQTEAGFSGVASYYSDWINALRVQITALQSENGTPIKVHKDNFGSVKLDLSPYISDTKEFFLGPLLVRCHIKSDGIRSLGDKRRKKISYE